jgi:hypothetical protein
MIPLITVAAADADVNGERIILLVSMYAVWEGHRPRPIYADASAHRLLSDLSGIVTDPDESEPSDHRGVAIELKT